MQAELEALAAALETPQRPVMALIGGAKVSTKLDLLGFMIAKVDILVDRRGDGEHASLRRGPAIGRSLCEHDMADTRARQILAAAQQRTAAWCCPIDAVVARGPRTRASLTRTVADRLGPARSR